MRFCGSVETVCAYQRVKKQPQSPDLFTSRATKANNHIEEDKSRRKDTLKHYDATIHSNCKMCVNGDDVATTEKEVESLGKCLSYSPDAPKALGIASKRRAPSSRSPCKGGFEPLDSSMEPHNNTTSIALLLVRYQSVVELSSSSSSTSSSSSSSSSPSTNSPHNNPI